MLLSIIICDHFDNILDFRIFVFHSALFDICMLLDRRTENETDV